MAGRIPMSADEVAQHAGAGGAEIVTSWQMGGQ